MKILVIGGTRFVGKALVSMLCIQDHEITVFTRGRRPVQENVEHIAGDRTNDEALQTLQGRSFDILVDSSGRTLEDSQRVISIVGSPKYRFLYVSSAGVYLNTDQFPIKEN